MSLTPATVPGPDAPLRAALRYGLIGLVVLAWSARSSPRRRPGRPVCGARCSAPRSVVDSSSPRSAVLLGAKLPPTMAGAVLLVSWVGKMLLAMLVIVVLNQFDFYSRHALVLPWCWPW